MNPTIRRHVVQFSFKRATAIIALGTLALLTVWAQGQQKQWKDRAEYDLFEQIRKEASPQTKIDLLKQWQQKYPDSQWKDERYTLMIQTYQTLGNAKGMLETAKEMVAADPKSVTGLYYLNLLTISMGDTSPAALDTGEKAAKGLLGLMDEVFSPAKKPAQVTDDQWKKERSNTEAVAYRTLGWVALQKQQYEDAEKNFIEVLKLNPADSQASLWAGTAIVRQKKLEKQGLALFDFARAAVYDGPGAAFDQKTRDQIKASFEKNYVNFHGDKNGMDEVLKLAASTAIPPAGFKIESKDELLIKQEEELKKTNPNLALWISIKRELTGANGAQYFDSNLKNANIPGGADIGGTKIEKFKAKVVSSDPPKRPKKVVVGISSPDMSEVTLVFENPLASAPEKGTDVEFSGVPVEFTADPFNLTFDVEPKDVSGLATAPAKKAAPAPAPAKKAAPKK
jgi:tetratricopeptide (TPR) repeat protein